MKSRVPFFLLFALLLLSCSRPSSYEEFVKLSDSDDGVFEFRIDMSDTTGTYDIFLFTRTDRSEVLGISERKPQKLVMEWVSPSERVYDECVYMDLGNYRGKRQLYRSGIVPSENGVWKLNVKTDGLPRFFRGIGIVCVQNGTR